MQMLPPPPLPNSPDPTHSRHPCTPTQCFRFDHVKPKRDKPPQNTGGHRAGPGAAYSSGGAIPQGYSAPGYGAAAPQGYGGAPQGYGGAPQGYGGGGGAFIPGQQWSGQGPNPTAPWQQAGGNWAGVASAYTPGAPVSGAFEPSDEEMLWLEQEMAAASGGEPSKSQAQAQADESGLTEEEWTMLEQEMALAEMEMGGGAGVEPSRAAGSPDTPADAQPTDEELMWLAQEMMGPVADPSPVDQMGSMLGGLAIADGAPTTPGAAARQADAELLKASADIDCCICIEAILGKPAAKSRRFALLSNCDHAFCVDCIQKWRGSADAKTTMVRECPTCRTTSHFYVPSPFFAKGADKERVIAAFKARCGGIHCVHFKRGEGTCPFGTSCFYRHEREDGTFAKERPRYLAGADGEAAPMQNIRVSDFLDARDAAQGDSRTA
jgi:hypothetical protein